MPVKTTDFYGHDYVDRPHLTMRQPDPVWGYQFGAYWSRHGIVDVYRQPPKERDGRSFDGLTAMTTIIGGRTYSRSWRRGWPDQTVARLAREFADEVAGSLK